MHDRKRIWIMAAVIVLATIVAVPSAIGAFAMGINWLSAVFVAALAAGFGAQIWFIAGLRRAKKGV
jgi:hypothetical protein